MAIRRTTGKKRTLLIRRKFIKMPRVLSKRRRRELINKAFNQAYDQGFLKGYAQGHYYNEKNITGRNRI
jgi:hypothetical protein